MILRRRGKLIFLLFVLVPLLAGCSKEKETPPPNVPLNVNLIVNPSFEESKHGMPVGWKLEPFEGEGKIMTMCGLSTKEKKTGKASFYLRGLFNTEKWMTLVQRHEVLPNHKLYFSAEIKTLNMKKNKGQKDRANIYVRFYDKNGKRIDDRHYADAYTHPRIGTTKWARSRKEVVVPKNARYAELGLICQMTGRIYFDDVEMILRAPIPWKKKSTKYIDFYYMNDNPLTKDEIERECDYVEKVLKATDVKVKQKPSYYYYPSEKRYREILKVKKVYPRVSWKARELHTVEPFDDHEIIHLLLMDEGYPPFGLAEGIVFFFKGDWNGYDLHMLAKNYLLQKKLPPLYKAMDVDNMRKYGSSIVVPGWCSFSKYLIDHYGMKKFMKLYRETNGIKEPGPFNVHFKKIYGNDFVETDKTWRIYLLRYKPKNWINEQKGETTGTNSEDLLHPLK